MPEFARSHFDLLSPYRREAKGADLFLEILGFARNHFVLLLPNFDLLLPGNEVRDFSRNHFDLLLPYGLEVKAGLDFPCIMPLLVETSLFPLDARSGGDLYPPRIKLY